MKKKGIFLGFVFLIATCAVMVAQEIDNAKPQILINLAENDGQSGQIEIIQPEQAENLLKMRIANNRLKKGEIPGYRVQVFSESGQAANKKSDEVRVNCIRNFSNLETHKEYNNPNWQIFVGDFRTRNEALREIQKIKKIYPGAFIVSTNIQISK